MSFNEEKFRALVQYVCYRCPDPEKLGATKLNKILLYSDVFYFIDHGESLTGETYVKLQYGPVPRHVLGALETLKAQQKLVIRQPEFEGEPRLFIATEKPALNSLFTADQISLVDSLISEICNNHTAKSISDASHDEVWELARMGEEIPCEAFMASRLVRRLTQADVQWAKDDLAGASPS